MMILRQIQDSIYNPEFYRQVRSDKFGVAFSYYYKLALWVALLSALVVGFTLGPRLGSLLNTLNDKILTNYPTGLEVTIKDGRASTNQSTPVIIPLPATSLPAEARDNMPTQMKNLLVIDTTAPFNLETFKNYQTAVLLTADSLVSYDRGQAVTIRNLQNWPKLVINQANLTTWSGWLRTFAGRWLLPFAILGAFVLVFLLFTLGLAYLLVASLLVYLVALIRQNKMTYSQAYRVALHAVTLPVLVWTLSILFYPVFFPPFLFTLVLLLVVAINLKPVSMASATV